MRLTEEQYREAVARLAGHAQALVSTPLVNVNPARKFKNQPVEYEGLKFDSKLELADWKNFQLMKANGEIRSVARQVSFCLPGTKRRIRIDHMVTELDGRQTFYDSKGFETPEWQLKRDLVCDGLGITIHLLKRK